jgi:hypothetical protein
MTKSNNGDSLLGAVFSKISAAGNFFRTHVAPTVDQAIKHARGAKWLLDSTRTILTAFGEDGNARQTLKEQWELLKIGVQQGASDAISNVRGIPAVSWEILSGLHPKIGLALLELYRLESVATTKLATEATELVAAKEYFDALKLKVETNGQADLTADLERMDALLAAAREAIAGMPGNESEVRRLFITVTGMVEETARMTIEYSKLATEYASKFGGKAINNPITGSPLDEIKSQLAAVEVLVRSPTPMQAAVQLSNVNCLLTALQDRYAALTTKFVADTQELKSLEGLMNTMVNDAQQNGFNNDPELIAAGRAFLTATRTAPINLAQAAAQKDRYIKRLETLEFGGLVFSRG